MVDGQYYLFASQIVHLSVADAGLDNMQVEHVQLAPAAEGPFIPAPDQSKATTGGAARLSTKGTAVFDGNGALKSYTGSEADGAVLASSFAA